MISRKEQHFREEPTHLRPAILRVEEEVKKKKPPPQNCPAFILQLAMHQVSINTAVVRARHLSLGQCYTQKQGEKARNQAGSDSARSHAAVRPTPPRGGDPPQKLHRAAPGEKEAGRGRQRRGRVCSGRHCSPPHLSSPPRCLPHCKKTLRTPPQNSSSEWGVGQGAHPDHAASAQQAVPCLHGVGLGLLARKISFRGTENRLFKKNN